MSYFRPNIEKMSAYVPGDQPPAGAKYVKLNTNENPYPPSPLVRDAMRGMMCEDLRIYPNPRAREFVRAAANLLNLPEKMILAANGSDNLIMMIARAAAGPGGKVAYPSPTFPFYETQALVQDVEIVEVPFEEDFAFPLKGLTAARADVTFVANPNSPTGGQAEIEQLEALARSLAGAGLLVIDEAYVDFAEHNVLDLPKRCDNVIVLRTLSKGYSLAGLRLGFAVAQPELLEQLWKTKEIYNVSVLAERLGVCALQDQEHMRANVRRIKQSRTRLTDDLKALGWKVWPSQANFLLARPPKGGAAAVCEYLKARMILVRYFDQPSLTDKLRITVGTDEENAALVKALKERP